MGAHLRNLIKSLIAASILICGLALAEGEVVRVAVVNDSATQSVEQVALQTWDRLAKQLHYRYLISLVPDERTGFDLLRQQQVDVVLAVSASYEKVPGISFLDAYVDDAVAVVVLDQALSTWQIILPYIKVGFSVAFGLLMLLSFIVGLLVWFMDRRRDTEEFSAYFWRGVGGGFWFSLVNLATLGYGSKSPKTWVGKIIVGIWMLSMFVVIFSLIILLMAELTSEKLSRNTLTNLSVLEEKPISYQQGNTQSEKLVYQYSARPVVVNSITQALQFLTEKKTAAAFINYVDLHCYFKQNPNVPAFRVDYRFSLGNYAFAVAEGSPLASNISQTLYFMDQRGEVQNIENECKW